MSNLTPIIPVSIVALLTSFIIPNSNVNAVEIAIGQKHLIIKELLKLSSFNEIA
jgi:hypothetical protein